MKYKVYLRPLVIEDAKVSYRWRNNPNIWVYTRHVTNQEVTLDIEQRWLAKVLARENEKRFAICIEDPKQYIGNIQLTGIIDGNAEYHIFIGEENFWGKGIAKQATAQILDYAFMKLNLQKVMLEVHKENTAALSLYLQVGFKLLRSNGKDFMNMTLTKAIYEKVNYPSAKGGMETLR